MRVEFGTEMDHKLRLYNIYEVLSRQLETRQLCRTAVLYPIDVMGMHMDGRNSARIKQNKKPVIKNNNFLWPTA